MQKTDPAAYTTLQKHFADLRESAFDPADVGARLLSSSVIDFNQEWESSQSSVRPADRRAGLLRAVTGNGGPRVFATFVEVLQRSDHNKSICDKLIATYKSVGGIHLPTASGISVESTEPTTSASSHHHQSTGRLGETVTLSELSCFKHKDAKGKVQRLYVASDMAPKWREVGKSLQFSAADLDNIAISCQQNPEDSCNKMLSQWLQGYVIERDDRPTSWETLLDAIENARLGDLAKKLDSILRQ